MVEAMLCSLELQIVEIVFLLNEGEKARRGSKLGVFLENNGLILVG